MYIELNECETAEKIKPQEQFAEWAAKHLLVQHQPIVKWKWDDEKKRMRPAWLDKPLDDLLLKHANGQGTLSAPAIGTFGTTRQNQSIAPGWDWDNHEGDTTQACRNAENAFEYYEWLKLHFVSVLLTDSDGQGGFHLWLPFDKPMPSEVAYQIGQFMLRKFPSSRAIPEVFPDRPALDEAAPFGKSLRLPGRHPNQSVWEKVWTGTEWLALPDAYEYIASLQPNTLEMIPPEMLAVEVVKREWHETETIPLANDEAEYAVERYKKYLEKFPPAVQHQGGEKHTRRAIQVGVIGFNLSQDDVLEAMSDWNDRCDPPWSLSDLRPKIRWYDGWQPPYLYVDANGDDHEYEQRGFMLDKNCDLHALEAQMAEMFQGDEFDDLAKVPAEVLNVETYSDFKPPGASESPNGTEDTTETTTEAPIAPQGGAMGADATADTAAEPDDADKTLSDAPEASSDGWAAPIELKADHVVVPDFPIDIIEQIVPSLAAISKSLAHHLQVPVDLPAAIGLSILSIPLAGRYKVEIAKGAFCEPMVWTFVALGSGIKKSPAMDALKQPIIDWQAEQKVASFRTVQAAQITRDLQLKRIEEISRKLEAKDTSCEQQEILIKEMLDLKWELDKPAPVPPRLLVSDSTPEAAAGVMFEQGRVAVLDDEGTFLENIAGKYSNKPSYGLCLTGWSGGTYCVDRVKGGQMTILAARMVLGIAAQPEVLSKVVNDRSARELGFVPRFLVAYPEDNRGCRLFTNDQAMPQSAIEDWNHLVKSMLNSQTDMKRLEQHPDNWQLLRAVHDKYEPQLKHNGALRQFASWVDKSLTGFGQICRVAATLHVASGESSAVISPKTLNAAIRIVEYFCEHAKKVYGLQNDNEGFEVATNMLAKIREQGLAEFKQDYFDRRIRSLRKDKELRNAALELLVRHRLIRIEERMAKNNRAFRLFVVNPGLFGQTTSRTKLDAN